jgi:hypothetical protein
MAVPNTFATDTGTIPLSELDANFSYYDTAYSVVGTTVNFTGNVGVNTASPSSLFTVNGESNISNVLFKQNVSAYTTGSSIPVIARASGFTGVYASGSLLLQARSDAAADIAFITGTTPEERVRIDSSGNLLVNTISAIAAAGYLQVSGATSTQNGIGIKATGSGTQFLAGFYNSASTVVGSINTNGTTTAYSTSSDYRLKENIAPMTGALAKVDALKPVTYKWKADGSDSQGFIAHELQAVVPDCVTGEKDAVDADGNPKYQGIDTSFLVATLTAAIQEQQAIITSLTDRITALEAK